ncbi:hypothetical protein OG373_13755 [Streptomyces avidinii]|uniref:hypothetical protein n=1 Tax=Streptomyces avidinii TaxID=1895 RepID=UPI00386862A3|nr:hypothetical protein OG373_13755 [Streptomyces avidinii]
MQTRLLAVIIAVLIALVVGVGAWGYALRHGSSPFTATKSGWVAFAGAATFGMLVAAYLIPA